MTHHGLVPGPLRPRAGRGASKLSEQSRRACVFVVGTFVVSWGAWWSLAALSNAGAVTLDAPAGWALFVLGGTAPTWVAYLAVWRTPEAGPLREFNRRVLRWRVPLSLLAAALLGAAALGVVSMALAGLLTSVSWPEGRGALAVFVPAVGVGIVFGGIEEVGWRGALQPAVTARWNLLTANLVIAAVWTIWHLPLFWVVGTSQHGAPFGLFVLAGFGYSAIMTWLYARTQSVALCVLFHAGISAAAAAGLAFSFSDMPGFAVQALVVAGVGVSVLVFTRRR